MAIDFPNSPSVNDVFTVGNKSWTWDGVTWKSVAATSANLAGLSSVSIASPQVGHTLKWDGTQWVNQTPAAHDTDDVAEGSSNLYYTDARADARIAAADTGDLSEGSNLYYTDARAKAAVSASDVGLGNVDNTSDADKPVSTATQTALNAKADATSLTAASLRTALGIPEYQDDAAAVTGGLASGELYFNTTTNTYMLVHYVDIGQYQ